MPNKIVIREFGQGDGPACSGIFSQNLSKYYPYLTEEQRKAMLSVNRPEDFERMSNSEQNRTFTDRSGSKTKTSVWEENRIFVITENGEIVGYFHFGKEGRKLRLKRVQFSAIGRNLFRTQVLPVLEQYRKSWGCKEIVGYAPPHWKDFLPKINAKIIGTKPFKVGGIKMPNHTVIRFHVPK